MKVIYILNSTLAKGGATKSFMLMLKGIIRKGVDVQVVLPDNQGIYGTLQQLNVTTHVCAFRQNVYPKFDSLKNKILFVPRIFGRIVLNKLAVKRLKETFKYQHIDIIHTNVSVVKIGFNLAKALHVKHIYHIREYGDLDFGLHYFPCRWNLLNQLHKTGTYSICITKDIQRHFNLSSHEKSVVIYNGIIQKQDFFDMQMPEKKFLYAGRIEKAKGVLELVESYSNYVKRNSNDFFPLYIAGEITDKEYYSKILTIIHNNKLEEDVIFLGQVDEVETLMRKSWAIIIPSIHEGFGRCMAEAMANKCLVVGKDTGGTKEQFDNGLTLMRKDIGVRYQTGTELENTLETISHMSFEDRKSFVNSAFDVVNQLYTVEQNINAVFKLYNEILYADDI